jgi:hypothetical protein
VRNPATTGRHLAVTVGPKGDKPSHIRQASDSLNRPAGIVLSFLGGITAGTLFLGPLTGPASADPLIDNGPGATAAVAADIATTQRTLDQLNTDTEKATEEYDGGGGSPGPRRSPGRRPRP